jgi:hypothetical protein
MKKKLAVFLFLFAFLLVSFAPVVATAASSAPGTDQSCFGTATVISGGSLVTGSSKWTLSSIICRLEGLIGDLIPLLMGFAMLLFIWGVITYVIAGDEEAKTAGRDRMIWGIVGFAVIVCVWGLVAILANTFGLNQNVTVTLPSVDGQ